MDLVNNNYQDFLSLGGSLKGGEEKIEEVKLGLLGFWRDVEGLKARVGSRKTEIEVLISERRLIQRDIQLGRTLLEVDQRLSDLEEKLMLVSVKDRIRKDSAGSSDSGEESDEEQGISLLRLQRHVHRYVCIRRLMERVGFEHPFILKQEDRTLRIKKTVLLDLTTALKQAQNPDNINQSRVLKLLKIYSDMGEIGEAIRLLKEGKKRS